MPLEDENAAFCPHCGKPLTEQTAAEETAAEAAAEQQTPAEHTVTDANEKETTNSEAKKSAEPIVMRQETLDAIFGPFYELRNSMPSATKKKATANATSTAEESPTQEGAPKKPNGKLIGIVAAAIAVVAVALILLIPRLKQNAQGETPVVEPPAAEEVQPSEQPAEDADSADSTDAAEPAVSYSATAEELTDEVLARVVAVCGSEELTNRDLAYYYWNQYYSFQNAYGMYMAYLMDQTKALEDQMSPDGENTWQQMLLNSGVEMFQSIASLSQKAQAAQFQLSADSEQQLADLKDTCEQSAAYFGYDSGDAYIQSVFGPSASVDGYVEFCRKLLLTTEYLQSLVDAEAISDADVAAYYDEHAEDYAAQRVEKIDKPMVSIRHILIQPEGEQDEEGNYSDEAWTAAEQKANEVLQEWEAGDKTEERFGELAQEYSADGSATSGGLYENVYPGQMVTEFNDWCFADGRDAGDYGLVKTEYGYHIIYFCAASEQVYWYETAKADLQRERASQLEQDAMDEFDFSEDLTQAAIFDVLAESRAQNAAAQAEAEAAQSETTDNADASATDEP